MEKKLPSIVSVLFFLLFGIASQASVLSPPVVTPQIQASQCGHTLAALTTTISSVNVPGSASYRFKVTTTGENGQEQVITRPNRTFNLTQLGTYAFGTIYYIQVAVKQQNVWGAYGPQCSVTSPTPITKIQNSQCGLTLMSVSDIIYCNTVALAPGYRFRLTNVVNPLETYTIDRQLREFRMNLLPIGSGVTYSVEVAVKNLDGSYLPYGESCSITTPILYTKLQTSQCGNVLGALSDDIYCNLVPNAQAYRFRVTRLTAPGGVQILNKPLRTFTMNQLTGIQYNTPYKVEVSVKDSHGDYLAYGPSCTVITPGIPIPKIQLSQCELVAANTTDLIYADLYPGAVMYRFRLENSQVGYSQYIDRAQRAYSLNMFSGLLSGTNYTVKVAVKVNGTFTPYGKACDVTTPGSPQGRSSLGFDDIKTAAGDASPLTASLYPNPYSDYFSITASRNASAEVTVKVYDMTGRLLENHKITESGLPSLQMGQNFPPGVYNVVLSEDGSVSTMRVVKK